MRLGQRFDANIPKPNAKNQESVIASLRDELMRTHHLLNEMRQGIERQAVNATAVVNIINSSGSSSGGSSSGSIGVQRSGNQAVTAGSTPSITFVTGPMSSTSYTIQAWVVGTVQGLLTMSFLTVQQADLRVDGFSISEAIPFDGVLYYVATLNS
jgi:hypothetical protein